MNILIAFCITLLVYFVFGYDLKITVTYKIKTREDWTIGFTGKTIFHQINGFIKWTPIHKKDYSWDYKVKWNLIKGFIYEIDTHGKGGWERTTTEELSR